MPRTSPLMLTMTLPRFPSFDQIAGTRSKLFVRQSSAINSPTPSKIAPTPSPLSNSCPGKPCKMVPGMYSTIATNSLVPLVIARMLILCSSTMGSTLCRAPHISKNTSSLKHITLLAATRTPNKFATCTARASATAPMPWGFRTMASDSPTCTNKAPPVPPGQYMYVLRVLHETSSSTDLLFKLFQNSARATSSNLLASFFRRCSSSFFCRSS
mmetsp:Transcript_45438/g.145829  ORF Transcript_45438/g.145829 Transcript_45438/m.145829 type:complete len:213 (+) Transcript_45438:440-1078(+)